MPLQGSHAIESCVYCKRQTGGELAHDPKKWAPVFRRDKRKSTFARRSCANNKLKRDCVSTRRNRALRDWNRSGCTVSWVFSFERLIQRSGRPLPSILRARFRRRRPPVSRPPPPIAAGGTAAICGSDHVSGSTGAWSRGPPQPCNKQSKASFRS